MPFSKKTLDFISKASRQKNPQWLERNRDEYESFVLEPLKEFAFSLKKKLAHTATGYNFPQRGFGRLKRSANSAREYGAPYRDWISYSASRPRVSRFDHNPNLYLLIQPHEPDGDTVLLAGGLYMPSSRQMRALREAISENSAPFEQLFASRAFSSRFSGGFCREKTSTRNPRGFDPNHPRLEWIRLQAFFVWRRYSRKEFYSRSFADLVAQDGTQILRLNSLLDLAISGRHARVGAQPSKEQASRGLTSLLEGIQAPQRKMDF